MTALIILPDPFCARWNSNSSSYPKVPLKRKYCTVIQYNVLPYFFYPSPGMTLKYFFLNFCSAINKVNDLMYIAGDMNVVELVTLLREELVC